MSFQSGLTERFIGGAVIPKMKAETKIDCRVCMVFKSRISEEYKGTKIRIGHFCPNLSMTDPRRPAVTDPANEFNPMAKPATATDPVDCSALKNIPSPIIP